MADLGPRGKIELVSPLCEAFLKKALDGKQRRQLRTIFQQKIALVGRVVPGQSVGGASGNWFTPASMRHQIAGPTVQGTGIGILHRWSYRRPGLPVRFDQVFGPIRFRVTVVFSEGNHGGRGISRSDQLGLTYREDRAHLKHLHGTKALYLGVLQIQPLARWHDNQKLQPVPKSLSRQVADSLADRAEWVSRDQDHGHFGEISSAHGRSALHGPGTRPCSFFSAPVPHASRERWHSSILSFALVSPSPSA